MKRVLTAIALEMKLEIKEMFVYKISLLSDFIVFTVMYVAIYYMDFSSGFMEYYLIDEHAGKLMILFGYIFWQLNSLAIGCTSSGITGDALRGILELRMQSKFPIPLLASAKMLVCLLIQSISFIGIFLFSVITMGVSLTGLWMVVCAIITAIPSLIGSFGIGLILGGVTLVEKNIGQFIYIVQLLLLVASNSLSPTRGWYGYVFPFTYGVEIARNIYIGIPISINSLVMYAVVNVVWVVSGILIFNRLLKLVRKRGTFAGY